jgi:hypothetical protein
MKNRVLLLALALVSVLLAGCQTTVGYKCTTTITPAETKDISETLYKVQIELTRIRTSGASQSKTVICSPTLACAPGESAKITVSDEKEESGFFATVFIPELDAGGTTRCSVHLKEKGQTKYLSNFQLTLPDKPSPPGG